VMPHPCAGIAHVARSFQVVATDNFGLPVVYVAGQAELSLFAVHIGASCSANPIVKGEDKWTSLCATRRKSWRDFWRV
jgi:hypothetical protein